MDSTSFMDGLTRQQWKRAGMQKRTNAQPVTPVIQSGSPAFFPALSQQGLCLGSKIEPVGNRQPHINGSLSIGISVSVTDAVNQVGSD